jgi:hypothetical protein
MIEASTTQLGTDMSKEFEALLGQYWDLAYLEGKSGASQGDKANEVLSALRKMAALLRDKSGTDYEKLHAKWRKGRQELANLTRAHEAMLAKVRAEQPAQQGQLSFNCSAGCGACSVKLQDFVTHQTQAKEGDQWVAVDSVPQIVSTCCGSPVEVWDERKQDTTARVEAAPQAQRKPLTPEFEADTGYSRDERAAFTAGWEAAEAAHGITKGEKP